MKKSFSRLAVALVVAAVMSLAFALPAMAATTTPGQVTLTKDMSVPNGTATPAFTFDFVLSQVAVVTQGTGGTANEQNMPGTTFTTTVPSGEAVPFPTDFTPAQITVPANTTTATTIVDFNALIPTAAAATWGFPNAGVFHFLVSEAQGTNTVGAGSTLTYDQTRYVISVEVVNVPVTATNPRGLEVRNAVTVEVTAPVPAIAGVQWVAGTTKTDPDWENIYVTTTTFQVNKVITGDTANMDEVFSISTSLVLPDQARDSVPPQTTAPTATVVWHTANPNTVPPQVAGAPVTPAPTVAVTGTGTAADPFVFVAELGHNQRLQFDNVVAGTTFSSTETQLPGFTGQAIVAGPGATTVNAAEGANVVVPSAATRYVSDEGNSSIAFTNNYRDMLLTGLVVGSMPVLAVLLVATALLAMAVASRSRQRIEQLPVAL